TVMCSFTRVGLSFSTVVFTMLVRFSLLGRPRHAAPRAEVWGADVGATGFEPATSRSQSGRSTKLSYAPRIPHSGTRNGLDESIRRETSRLTASRAPISRHTNDARPPPFAWPSDRGLG